MRIYQFLLVAGGAAAMGGAALAQSGTLPGRPSGNPPSVSGSWLPKPHFGKKHDFRRGPDRHDGRRGRHHRRFGRGAASFVFPYGGVGYAEEFAAVDPHGAGFFAGGGGEVRFEGGRPYYDYDRGYPYEWASAAFEPSSRADGFGVGGYVERCTAEHGVRVCRGRR